MEKVTNQDILNELLDIRQEQKQPSTDEIKKPKSDLVDIIESKIAEQNTKLEQRLNDSADKKMASMFEKIKSNIDSPSFSITPIPVEKTVDKFDKESIAYKSTWQELLNRMDTINTKINSFPTEIKLSDNDSKLLQSFSEMIQKNVMTSIAQPVSSDKNSISVDKIDIIITSLNKQVTQIAEVSASIKEFTKTNTAAAVTTDNSKLLEAITNLQDNTKSLVFEQTKQQLQAIQSLKDALPTGNNKELIDALTKISNLDFSALNQKRANQVDTVADAVVDTKPSTIIQQAQNDINYIKSLSEAELTQLKKVAETLPVLTDTIKGFAENLSKVNLTPLNKVATDATTQNKKFVTLDQESLDALKSIKDSIKPETATLIKEISRDINSIAKPLNTPALDNPLVNEVNASFNPIINPTVNPITNTANITTPTVNPVDSTQANINPIQLEKPISNDTYLKQGTDIINAINDLQKKLSPSLDKINDSIQSILNTKTNKKVSTNKLNTILKEVQTINQTKDTATNTTRIDIPQISQFQDFKKAFDVITPSLSKMAAIPAETLNKGVEAISSVGKDNSLKDTSIETLKPIITEVLIPSIKQDIQPIVKPDTITPTNQSITQNTNDTFPKTDINSTVKPKQASAIDTSKPADIAKTVEYDNLAKSDIKLKLQDSPTAIPSVKPEVAPEKEKERNSEIKETLKQQNKLLGDLIGKISKVHEPEKKTDKTKDPEKKESSAITNISVNKNQQSQENWQEVLIAEIRKMNGKLDSLSANLLRKNTNNGLEI